MSDALPEGVSVYDRLVWPDGALEHYLATGERRRELIAYLGAEEYAALVPLAQTAARMSGTSRGRVLLVPGIMGSQLGVARPPPLPADLLWIDPSDYQHGGLLRLALGAEDVESRGPVVYSYLRLKLALAAQGWSVGCFDYDWRHGVQELGRRLRARLANELRPVHLVGHSMGGLVARAALAGEAAHIIGRIVTLGTPHAGSYAPLQALRGVYGTVRRLAQLDPAHSAEALAERVFGGFPSLYDMLPRHAAPDWLRADSWPDSAPLPRADELDRAAALCLPDAPDRLYCIAGTGQPTVTAARAESRRLIYRLDAHGDGTVPVASAVLAGHGHRYTTVPHSELPRDADVAAAVADLLESGGTTRLSMSEPATVPPMPPIDVDESELRALFNEKLDWQAMSAEERRAWLDSLNSPVLPLAT